MEHDAAPRLNLGIIPLSAAFSILNSLGLIGLSIFFIDMTGFSTLTRAIAFLSVGIVIVLAAVAYGLWRYRINPPSDQGSSD